jgi:transposase
LRLKKHQMKEAVKMLEDGKSVDQIAYHFSVHYDTMRRYFRHYKMYGESLWSPYPVERIEE